MDRPIVYAGAIPQDTDLLNTNKNTMLALGMALQAILGTATVVDGLACTPTGPASLQVYVGPGSIYAYANVDGTAYGSLAADTTHQIVKQGINLGTLTLSCPAPATTGYSINYLIEACYQDADTGSTVLPYYNSSNPSVAYSGPGGLGTSQNTVRQGQCVVTVKAGVAATTGSQVTPAVDSGYVGLWVVTVANGQTQITSPNIVAYSGAPFIANKLPSLLGSINSPLVGLTRNAKMSVTAASASATFTADEVIVETALGGIPYKLANFSQTINLATTGAGGMDTGAAPVSGYVALYAIYNPSTATKSILAVNATSAAAPNVYGGANMPAGYTASALISVWPTNASSQFVVGLQIDRTMFLNSTSVLSSSTSVGSTPVSLSISGAVPANAKSVSGAIILTSTAASSSTVEICANAAGLGATWVSGYINASANNVDGYFNIPILTPQTIYYSSVSGGGTPTYTINISGYTI